MVLGVQIFGCMGVFRRDPAAFMKRLYAMGYRLVEPCLALDGARLPGFASEPLLVPDELPGFMRLAAGAGLAVDSFHAFGDLMENRAYLLDVVKAYAVKRVVINGAMGGAINDVHGYAERALSAARMLQPAGAQLLIHNNRGAQTAGAVGGSWLERVIGLCQGEVGAQLDVGWALYGGQDPAAYMRRLGDGLRSLHYKDIAQGFAAMPESDIHVCLGQGCLDVAAVRSAVGPGIATQLIDQDASAGDFMDDLATSAALLLGND